MKSCIEWALNTLGELGYSIQNSTPETILQTPWSSVYHRTSLLLSQAFFSLSNILHWIKKNGVLQSDTFQALQQQALQPWLDYAPRDYLLKALSLIQQHWSIYAVLAEYRLLTSVDSLDQLLGKARLAKQLRVWLTQASSNNTGDIF